ASDRVVTVGVGVTATLSGLTIRHGDAATGGGVRNDGTLTLSNVAVVGNRASGQGGGIYNAGTLTVANSTVAGNVADHPAAASAVGGGIYAATGSHTTITQSTVSGNTAEVDGGGIYDLNGTLALTNSTVSGNSAPRGG